MECIVGIKIWMSRNVWLLNSFPTKCSYTSPERVQNHSIKNTDEEDAETSDLIYKHMHMKNNAIIDAYKWKLSKATEWNVDPESMKLWDTDGSHLLHLCSDDITEYDPDVVFDKYVAYLPTFKWW